MNKRIVTLFCIIAFSLSSMVLRFAFINIKGNKQSATYGNTRSITIDKSRGTIYDCNLKPITNATPKYFLAVKPTPIALSQLKGTLPDDEFDKLAKNLSDGNPTVIALEKDMKPVKDTRVIKTMQRYSKNQLATHIVGHLDSEGNGAIGLEKGYNEYLSKDSGGLAVAFGVDALGRPLIGADIEVRDANYNIKQGIVLTINKDVQEIAEKALDNNGIDSGCAVVVEVGTGEIKAMASRPTFDPNNLASSLSDARSPFINRCITQYTVGSSFKVLVSACAIENKIATPNTMYNCTGNTQRSGVNFSCYNKNEHGNINMTQALSVSCNTYFIELANKMDMNLLLEMSKNMGLSQSTKLAQGMVTDKGNLPEAYKLNSQASIANFAFGQGELLATPLQMACVFATIASDGYYTQPFLIKGMIDKDGEISQEYKAKSNKKVMSQTTAKQVRQMLKTVVEENENALPNNTTGCGKTATAQSGWLNNGAEIYHSWFVGFFPAEKPKYAVAVMKENGASGSADCAPVFREIAQNVTSLNS